MWKLKTISSCVEPWSDAKKGFLTMVSQEKHCPISCKFIFTYLNRLCLVLPWLDARRNSERFEFAAVKCVCKECKCYFLLLSLMYMNHGCNYNVKLLPIEQIYAGILKQRCIHTLMYINSTLHL